MSISGEGTDNDNISIEAGGTEYSDQEAFLDGGNNSSTYHKFKEVITTDNIEEVADGSLKVIEALQLGSLTTVPPL